MPESWGADGGETNRATAGEQTDVGYKALLALQSMAKQIFGTLLAYAYDNLADLQNYELLILSNVPATSLSQKQMEVARTYELDPERVKLLPAGILLIEEASTRLGLPLQIARGGLREGVILEMMGDPS